MEVILKTDNENKLAQIIALAKKLKIEIEHLSGERHVVPDFESLERD